MVIREREARVLELAARGRTQRDIAAELGISQPAVCKIQRRVEERLLATMHRERVRYLARLTLRTDHVYRQAQEAWDRSCAERRRRRQRLTTTDGGAATAREVVEIVQESQAGDPRFLREQLRAVGELRTLLRLHGLDWTHIARTLEDNRADDQTPEEES